MFELCVLVVLAVCCPPGYLFLLDTGCLHLQNFHQSHQEFSEHIQIVLQGERAGLYNRGYVSYELWAILDTLK